MIRARPLVDHDVTADLETLVAATQVADPPNCRCIRGSHDFGYRLCMAHARARDELLAFVERLVGEQPAELGHITETLRGARAIASAIAVPGPYPEVGRKVVWRTKKDWPTLWAAIEQIVEVHDGR